MRFSTTPVVLLLLCPLACAHGLTVEKLERDTYRLTCTDVALDRCLREAGNACDGRPYFVARGISDVNYRGLSETPDVMRSSQAIIRCGPAQGWSGEAKSLMPDNPVSAAAPAVLSVTPPPAPAAPKSVCAPGATQPCTGPAACSGGQACKSDGSGYDVCDCGQPSAPPSPPEPKPPS